MENQKEEQSQRPDILRLINFRNRVAWAFKFFGYLNLFLGLFRHFVVERFGLFNWPSFIPFDSIVWGIVLILIGVAIGSLKFPQPPERWIIERLGSFHCVWAPRDVERGEWPFPHVLVPVVDTIRARVKVSVQGVPIFTKREGEFDLDLRDDSIQPIDPKVYVRISSEHPEYAVYKVDFWPEWIEDNIQPFIRGWANGLTLDQALNRGMLQGDILDKIKNFEPFITQELERIQDELEVLPEEFVSLRSLLEEDLRETQDFKMRLGALQEKLKELENQASEFSIEIVSVLIGDFKVSEESKEARRGVQKAKRELEAARYESQKEAIMRARPVKMVQEEFIAMGLPEQEAQRKAYELAIVNILASNKQMFVTSAVGAGEILAQASAIFTRAAQAAQASGASKTQE